MAYVARERHIDYVASGSFVGGVSGLVGRVIPTVPRVVELPADSCLDNGIGFGDNAYGPRHIDYTLGQATNNPPANNNVPPIAATFVKCCDAVSDTYVQQDCWPGGITSVAFAYLNQILNCSTAQGKRARLIYNPASLDSSGNPQWVGTVSGGLRGGNLDLYWSCQSGVAINDPNKFRLDWRGCSSGVVFGPIICFTPIRTNFGNMTAGTGSGGFTKCCDCDHTSRNPDINTQVVANCPKDTFARHIDYTLTGIPVVAQESNCLQDQPLDWVCAAMTCGLTAVLTSISGTCGCLAGTYNLEWVISNWQANGIGTCSDLGSILLICSNDYTSEGKPTGTVTLTITVTCGANDTGSASITIPAIELDTLDVTFNVALMSSSPPCTGVCTYFWTAMSASWAFISSTCSASCAACADGTTLPPPADPSVDQFGNFACTPGTPDCCIGSVSVRVMR